MHVNSRFSTQLSRFLCTAILGGAGACHTDIAVENGASATDGEGYFTGSADESSSEPFTPTTSAGEEPGDGPIDPLKFCELHPDESYEGVAYTCAGEASAEMSFDYYGDPDLNLNAMLPCLDLSKWVPKGPGYVYTCYSGFHDRPFGPGVEQPNGRRIGACCLEGSPEEAVLGFCTIDAAEESCRSLSDGLNDLRKSIPVIPKLYELNDQLERLNAFLAEAESQTTCSSTVAKELLKGGVEQQGNVAVWHPESAIQEDPDLGWRWFRAISLRVDDFLFTETVETGESCQDSEFTDLLEGRLETGALEVEGMGTTGVTPLLNGTYALSTSACGQEQCPIRLDSLRVVLRDFAMGSYQFTDLDARIVAPVIGEQMGTKIAFVGERMEFEVRGRLNSTERTAPGGSRVAVRVCATDTVTAAATPDGRFVITELRVNSWPFETKLTAGSSAKN